MKNNLKLIRKVLGCSQNELAYNLGVSNAMISMWENNSNEKIPDSRVKQICDYLNVSPLILFGEYLEKDLRSEIGIHNITLTNYELLLAIEFTKTGIEIAKGGKELLSDLSGNINFNKILDKAQKLYEKLNNEKSK